MTGRYPERDQAARCPRCGAAVAPGWAFCQECGLRLPETAPERDSFAGRSAAFDDDFDPSPRSGSSAEPSYEAGYYAELPPARGGMPPWVIPAFIATAIVALGLGAVLAIVLGGPDGDPVGGASATPTPIASAGASASSGETPAPTPTTSATSEPTSTPSAAFANRSILEVAVGALNLRSQAGTDSTVVGSLGEGARLFVIGERQEAAGERWYRVAVVSGPYSRCEPQSCPRDLGYVAEGAAAADGPYLSEATLDCPASPMTAEELAALAPLERLSCYGGNPIVVTGTLDHCYCDGPQVVEYEPSWLAAPVSLFLFDGTTILWLRFEEGLIQPADLEAGDIVEATVAMEHPASTECSASGPGENHPTKAEIVLSCRAEIVVQELTVTGHDEGAVGP